MSINPLLAAGWGPLIPFIVFFVFITLSLMHAAYRHSQRTDRNKSGGWEPEPLEEGEEVAGGRVVGRYVRPGAPPQLPPMAPPTPRSLSPWELELERVLRRDPPPLQVPPAEPPRPTPASPSPSPFDWSALSPGPSVEELTEADLENAPMPTAPLATLAPAQRVYSNAATLQERVQSFLQKIDAGVDRPVSVVPVRRPAISSEMATFVAGLRSPVTARHAVLASLVLGPPKALDI